MYCCCCLRELAISDMVKYLYGTAPGRLLIKSIQKTHFDRVIIRYLKSGLSRPYLALYRKNNDIPYTDESERFHSFEEFFSRKRDLGEIDREPSHLISPCDALLSAYPISRDSVFAIKGSYYQIRDFLEDETLANTFDGGTCLVFRLCPSDYHYYIYIDDGYQGKNHFIPGILHSVQPIACSTYPVYTLNRRSWCLMETKNFGPVVQTEIGALVVGGINNYYEDIAITRGMEKGRFELAGSTIVLLFEKDRIELLPELTEKMTGDREVRIEMGQHIGNTIQR